MRTAFIDTLCALAAGDERVWLLTGDLGFSVLERFARQFPGRFTNVGVAEQNMTGIAAGLAMSGRIVFTYSIANFPTLRCLEQVRNDVCYHRVNVKIVSVGGGYAYGPQGYTHHGLEDLAIMRALPDMAVLAPGDPAEVSQAVAALIQLDGPAYLRLGKAGEPRVHAQTPTFEMGRAIVVREGSDATLIATGGMLKRAVDAADALRGEGIMARVLSMHTIKPLDDQAVLAAARETGKLVTLEEHSVIGGLGSAVADVIATHDELPPVRFVKLAVPDTIAHEIGSQDFLLRRVGDPVETIRRLVRGTP